jgi:hypothetical protein
MVPLLWSHRWYIVTAVAMTLTIVLGLELAAVSWGDEVLPLY